MSLNQFKESECVLTTQKHCPCVEFLLADSEAARSRRHGFHASQLLDYCLQPNEAETKDAPPEKLTLSFATADVRLTGWRLDRIADHLREGDLLAVRALPARYAHLDPGKCFVAQITVAPFAKAGS